MDKWAILGIVGLAAGSIWVGLRLRRNAVRRALMTANFPSAWQDILRDTMPMYEHLPSNVKDRLKGYINVFMAEKCFEGCGGLEMTDEIRLTVAAQACLMLLHEGKCTFYPTLKSILIYPSAYVAENFSSMGSCVTVGESTRLGESWTGGAVVLAWDSVKRGAMDMKDGQNVVFHEFAHQLDQEDGNADGAPILGISARYAPWARVLSGEYRQLKQKAKRGKKSVLDRYGATNPAEFFAVATESFFEKPDQMKKKHPELYEELKDYYVVDPESWE
jgi:Mlc titration factor MtfA (ptsG expression regulator)